MLLKWNDLPDNMRIDEVKSYYEVLKNKLFSLIFKRLFDVILSLFLLIILSPLFLILAIAIKIESNGPIIYRQLRVTQYGRQFRIHKFRTMYDGSDLRGTSITISGDKRITKIGSVIRKFRLDEFPQLIDIFYGNMTFVGVRPEIPKFVEAYNGEMMATLLLPAGVTNLTCIVYKNEAEMLGNTIDPERAYIDYILPEKMRLNLEGLRSFSFWGDIKLMFMTFFALFGKRHKGK
jgi:lipopolysaccharide/colanic/teichoic acid biosynthesis glycosyltransferase